MESHKKILERLLNSKSFADYQLSITLPRTEAIALLNQIAEIKAEKAVVITGNAGVPDFYKEVIERTAEAAGRVKDWIFFDAVERWKKQGGGLPKIISNHASPAGSANTSTWTKMNTPAASASITHALKQQQPDSPAKCRAFCF